MHNNRYLPLTGLLTLLQWTIQPRREIFEIFQKYFTKYFMKYFTPKSFMKFYITSWILGPNLEDDNNTDTTHNYFLDRLGVWGNGGLSSATLMQRLLMHPILPRLSPLNNTLSCRPTGFYVTLDLLVTVNFGNLSKCLGLDNDLHFMVCFKCKKLKITCEGHPRSSPMDVLASMYSGSSGCHFICD